MLTLACTCGACWKFNEMTYRGVGDKAIMESWRELHSGPGHKECTVREAGHARVKAEREFEKERE